MQGNSGRECSDSHQTGLCHRRGAGMIDDDVMSCDHYVIPPQTVDKGDSVDVKYTGWLFDNGIGKVRVSLHHNDVVLMTVFVSEI